MLLLILNKTYNLKPDCDLRLPYYLAEPEVLRFWFEPGISLKKGTVASFGCGMKL